MVRDYFEAVRERNHQAFIARQWMFLMVVMVCVGSFLR